LTGRKGRLASLIFLARRISGATFKRDTLANLFDINSEIPPGSCGRYKERRAFLLFGTFDICATNTHTCALEELKKTETEWTETKREKKKKRDIGSGGAAHRDS